MQKKKHVLQWIEDHTIPIKSWFMLKELNFRVLIVLKWRIDLWILAEEKVWPQSIVIQLPHSTEFMSYDVCKLNRQYK